MAAFVARVHLLFLLLPLYTFLWVGCLVRIVFDFFAHFAKGASLQRASASHSVFTP